MVGIFEGGASLTLRSDPKAAPLITEQCLDQTGKCHGVTDRRGQRRRGRPFEDVPDRGADRGHACDRRLQRDDRAGLVARGHDQHMGSFRQGTQAGLCEEAVKCDPIRDLQGGGLGLNFTLQGVFAHDVQTSVDARSKEQREGAQQGG